MLLPEAAARLPEAGLALVPVAHGVARMVAAPVLRAIASLAHVTAWARLAMQLPASVASPYFSLLSIPTPTVVARGNGLRDLLSSRAFGPGFSAPVPGGVPFGGGVSSAAGGGSGFFFSGVAVAPALAALYVPDVSWTLRTFAFSRALEPFVLLLERPG